MNLAQMLSAHLDQSCSTKCSPSALLIDVQSLLCVRHHLDMGPLLCAGRELQHHTTSAQADELRRRQQLTAATDRALKDATNMMDDSIRTATQQTAEGTGICYLCPAITHAFPFSMVHAGDFDLAQVLLSSLQTLSHCLVIATGTLTNSKHLRLHTRSLHIR